MRRILRRWLLAGGARSFLAGYAGCSLIIGLMAAIGAAIANHSVAGLLIVPVVLLVCVVVCVMAPLGLILGVAFGFGHPAFPGWLRWGPWDGRLMFMGLMAGLVALVIVGRRMEKRNPVPNGGDDTPRVPSARVVVPYLFPTSTWNRLIGRLATTSRRQLIGPVLLVLAGAGFFCLGGVGLAVLGALDS